MLVKKGSRVFKVYNTLGINYIIKTKGTTQKIKKDLLDHLIKQKKVEVLKR